MGFNARLNPLPINWALSGRAATQMTATETVAIYRAPFACEVVDVGFVQNITAVAKSATNHCRISLLNGGAAGAGTSVIATALIGSAATVAALTCTVLTVTGTVAYKKLDAGDYLMVKYTETGTLTPSGFFGSLGVVFGTED